MNTLSNSLLISAKKYSTIAEFQEDIDNLRNPPPKNIEKSFNFYNFPEKELNAIKVLINKRIKKANEIIIDNEEQRQKTNSDENKKGEGRERKEEREMAYEKLVAPHGLCNLVFYKIRLIFC